MLKFFVILFFSMVSISALGDSVPEDYQVKGPVSKKVHHTNIQPPIDPEHWTDSAKVWLARSCVGESGFSNYDECLGIAWVYATRVKTKDYNLVTMVRLYSSAVKRSANKDRKWIFHLNLKGKRPRGWPKNLSWKKHKVLWLKLLSVLDDWSKGYYKNPVPGANHYGSPTDKPGKRWKRIRPKPLFSFYNRFYRGF